MNMVLWFFNLMSWSAQVALLALAAAFLPRLLQIRQPRVLLVYWRTLLGISLLLPLIQPWHRLRSFIQMVVSPAPLGASVMPAGSPVVARWYFPDLSMIARILFAVILAGIVVRFVILVLGLLKLRQFRRTSSQLVSFADSAAILEAMRVRVNTRGEFRLSTAVDSPVTFGFAAPVILLPERFPYMDERFQSAIACHELLHVRRRDWAHHLAEEIIRAAFWFHPAIAWLIARVRLAREQVVDCEVVRLTNARKAYLEALLEFTASRGWTVAIPAPPFLVERQLAERVSLMLKEVHMSRTRMIASLTAIGCCLAVTVTLAARTFPLRAVARSTQGQNASGADAAAVANQIATNLVAATAKTVASNMVGKAAPDDPQAVDRSTLWIDTVKRGPMVRQVRGLGTLVRAEGSASLVARVTLPEFMTADVHLNQNALVDTQKGLVKGHVSRVGPSSNGMRSVDIALDAALPEGAGVDLPVTGTVDIEKIENVLYVGRPIHGTPNTSVSLFKVGTDGTEATRVNVKFGRESVQTIEVLDGLNVGDRIILSDMSTWDKVDRIQIK